MSQITKAQLLAHKVTTKRSTNYADTVTATCTCGWYQALGTYNCHTDSLRIVRQELRWMVQDHLDEAKGLVA